MTTSTRLLAAIAVATALFLGGLAIGRGGGGEVARAYRDCKMLYAVWHDTTAADLDRGIAAGLIDKKCR